MEQESEPFDFSIDRNSKQNFDKTSLEFTDRESLYKCEQVEEPTFGEYDQVLTSIKEGDEQTRSFDQPRSDVDRSVG